MVLVVSSYTSIYIYSHLQKFGKPQNMYLCSGFYASTISQTSSLLRSDTLKPQGLIPYIIKNHLFVSTIGKWTCHEYTFCKMESLEDGIDFFAATNKESFGFSFSQSIFWPHLTPFPCFYADFQIRPFSRFQFAWKRNWSTGWNN